MIIGIPNVNSINLNRDANSVISARLHTAQVEGQPSKKPKKDGDKSAVAIERCTTVGLRISGHRDARIFADFTEEHKSLGKNSTSAIHKSYADP